MAVRKIVSILVALWINCIDAFPLNSRVVHNRNNKQCILHQSTVDEHEATIRSALQKVNTLMYRPETLESSLITNFFSAAGKLVEVKQSSIPGAGMGLFAKKQLKQGTIIGLYPTHCLGFVDCEDAATIFSLEDQEYFDPQNMENQDIDSYQLNILGGRPLLSMTMDATTSLFLNINPNRSIPNNGWSSHYINDSHIVHENSEAGVLQYYQDSTRQRNCVFVPFGPSPLMTAVTTSKIKKGQELFTSYGCVYWLEALLEQQGVAETTPITESIQEMSKESTRGILQARNALVVTNAELGKAFQNIFDE